MLTDTVLMTWVVEAGETSEILADAGLADDARKIRNAVNAFQETRIRRFKVQEVEAR